MKQIFLRGLPIMAIAIVGMTVLAAGQRHRKHPVGYEPGQLSIVQRDGTEGAICPLKHTSVTADIAGFGARVEVVQTFINPSSSPIEAVYTFPLPHDAAVDRMRIKIGNRVIEGVIKRREEARRIYDAARNAGQTAGLLDQERPNIFTQSVANIMPGVTVQVDISYVQVLKYEGGQFEFNYPMVVGPRYLGNAPDPGKIAPPVVAEGTRTGTTIDLNVHLDAGATVEGIHSVLHKINLNQIDDRHLSVSLLKQDEIPNRDFILRYQTATDTVKSAFLTSYDANNGGFFDLILLPPKAPKAADIAPREMIFVMDQSGSQSGFPIQKSKELTYKLLKTMRPGDTFNVYGFNTEVRALWNTPQSYTQEHLVEAHQFLDVMTANGGTNLLEGLRAALTVPKDPRRLRVVLFNTDGYVGDEENILREIKKDRNSTRIFTFGIGNSVNRFLIDAMSLEGKGDSELVTLAESADGAANRFVQRLRSPILTDVKASGQGIELTDMVPREIPDVFSDRPIVIQGRFPNPGHGRLLVTGRLGGKPWSQSLDLNFSPDRGDSCIATLWARKKVDDLVDRSFEQQYLAEDAKPIDFKSRITDIALQFGIMSEYTSFVAVEPRVVNVGGISRTVHVPVEMADGVSYQGVFGTSVAQHGLPLQNATALSPQYFGGGGFAANRPTGGVVMAKSSARRMGRGGSGGPGGFGGFNGAAGPAVTMKSKAMSDKNEDSLGLLTMHTYDQVVDRRLRISTGKVAIMVFLNRTDVATIAKLKKLGLNIDETDKKIKVVFGTCDAKVLKKLAELMEVDRISPIE